MISPQLRLLENIYFLLRAVVIGIGVAVVLMAPLFAWIYHQRHHEPLTRRSMVLATLGFVCLGAGPLCVAVANSVHDFNLGLILVLAGVLCLSAFYFLLLLAFPARSREVSEVSKDRADAADRSSEHGEEESEHSS